MKAIIIDTVGARLQDRDISYGFIYENITNNYLARYTSEFERARMDWLACLMRNEKSTVDDVDTRDICDCETSNKLCAVLSFVVSRIQQ